MAKWEALFSEPVLSRGYNYWLDGVVEELDCCEDECFAVVSGGDDYDVRIEFGAHGEVTDMDCTCPHADDGNNCKHMAAALYALEADGAMGMDGGEVGSGDSNKKVVRPEVRRTAGQADVKAAKPTASIEEAIESPDLEQLRGELLAAARADDALALHLIGMRLRQISAEAGGADSGEGGAAGEADWGSFITAMQKVIDSVFENCTDRYGYADWRNSGRLISELHAEVFADLGEIVQPGAAAMAAHQLAVYLFDRFMSIQMDGSGGEHGEFFYAVKGIWESILKATDRLQRDQIFSDLLGLYERTEPQLDFMGDYLYEFMLANFDKKAIQERRLAIVDAKMERLLEQDREAAAKAAGKKRPQYTHSFGSSTTNRSSWLFERLVVERLELMGQLGAKRDAMLAFRNEYRDLPKIRAMEMDELEQQGDLDGLIDLLLQSKEIDQKSPGMLSRYSLRLADCYQRQGQRAKAMAEAYKNVTSYDCGSLDGFRRYKALVDPEKWPKEREKVFKAVAASVKLNPLYNEEGLYDRIMAVLKKQSEEQGAYGVHLLSEIARYEDALRPKYEAELLEIYGKTVRAMARPASGRKGYQEIVGVLKRMLRYSGGSDCVKQLLSDWKKSYANRPAMQEELQAVWR